MRQIILDTETTGLNPTEGHKIIEIGCLELINRQLTGKSFHQYINPGREIDMGAVAVHGITQAFLADKPIFKTIVEEFLAFINGAQLIIHNAPFDLSFLDYEIQLLDKKAKKITDRCTVIDTLLLARQLHPGQRNSLDALCKRYNVNASQRKYHGALLDSELLAQVYLAMTGGQASLFGNEQSVLQTTSQQKQNIQQVQKAYIKTRILQADDQELAAHNAYLEFIEKSSKGKCVWKEKE